MARRAIRVLGVTLLSLFVVAAGAAGWWWHVFTSPGPLAEGATVIVPRGAGLNEIAALLARSGIIEDARIFQAGARVTGLSRRMRAGEFAFAPRISMRGAAEHLVSGETVKRRLTVPEGLTTAEIVELVRAAGGLTGEVTSPPAEGRLLPETYYYSWGDTRAEIIGRMRGAMDDALAAAWAARESNIAVSSPDEALVLASIIEKETAVADERRRISAVFHNRLRRGMRLQSDPTVVYGAAGGSGPLGRALTRADLEQPSAHNTYRIDGLPPTPIANPGRAALDAAVRPLDTRELYFVADGNGGHVFATTLREHNRNVAKWRRLQRNGTKP